LALVCAMLVAVLHFRKFVEPQQQQLGNCNLFVCFLKSKTVILSMTAISQKLSGDCMCRAAGHRQQVFFSNLQSMVCL
jgi:hypothetical protein